MVDLQLPSPHGGSLFDTMRELTDSYVVGIAPPDADNMRIRALRAGADDVVSTPVNPDELAARCQALLRRHGSCTQAGIRSTPRSSRSVH